VTLACFAAGTGIATTRGRVAVERLTPGTRVRLAGGGSAPIVWIGQRRIDCARHKRPERVLPIRIRAHAFAPNIPCRDLLLSPDHAVLADGHLVPAGELVNGVSILRENRGSVLYYHVELPTHGVLRAEGLAVESYLDTGNRDAFANVAQRPAPRGDAAPAAWHREAHACAPLLCHGPALDALRTRLTKRANAACAKVAHGQPPPYVPAIASPPGRRPAAAKPTACRRDHA